MSNIKFFSSQNAIPEDKSWNDTQSKKLQTKVVHKGTEYTIISAKERSYSKGELFQRKLLGVAAVVITLGIGLVLKSVQNLFKKTSEKKFFAVPAQNDLNIDATKTLSSLKKDRDPTDKAQAHETKSKLISPPDQWTCNLNNLFDITLEKVHIPSNTKRKFLEYRIKVDAYYKGYNEKPFTLKLELQDVIQFCRGNEEDFFYDCIDKCMLNTITLEGGETATLLDALNDVNSQGYLYTYKDNKTKELTLNFSRNKQFFDERLFKIQLKGFLKSNKLQAKSNKEQEFKCVEVNTIKELQWTIEAKASLLKETFGSALPDDILYEIAISSPPPIKFSPEYIIKNLNEKEKYQSSATLMNYLRTLWLNPIGRMQFLLDDSATSLKRFEPLLLSSSKDHKRVLTDQEVIILHTLNQRKDKPFDIPGLKDEVNAILTGELNQIPFLDLKTYSEPDNDKLNNAILNAIRESKRNNLENEENQKIFLTNDDFNEVKPETLNNFIHLLKDEELYPLFFSNKKFKADELSDSALNKVLPRVAKLYAKEMKATFPQGTSDDITKTLFDQDSSTKYLKSKYLVIFYKELIPNVVDSHIELLKDPSNAFVTFKNLTESKLVEGIDNKTKSEMIKQLSPTLSSTIASANSQDLAINFYNYLNSTTIKKKFDETTINDLKNQLQIDRLIFDSLAENSDLEKVCVLSRLITPLNGEKTLLDSAVRNVTNLKGENFQNAFETLKKTSQSRDILSSLDKDVRQNFLVKCILEAPNENGYEMIRYESTQRQYLDEIAEKIDLAINIDKLFEKPKPDLFTEFSDKEAITRNDLIELIKALEEAEKEMPRVYTGKRYEYLEVSNKLQEFVKKESSESTLHIEEVLKLIKIVDKYSSFSTNQFFSEEENLTYAQNSFKEGIAKLGKTGPFDKPTYRMNGSYYLDLYFAGIMQAVREKQFDNFGLLSLKYSPLDAPERRRKDFYETWDTYKLFLRECSGDELLTVIEWSSKRNEFYNYNAYQLVNKLIKEKTDEESIIRNLFQIIWNHAHPTSFLKSLYSPQGSLEDVFETFTTEKQFEIAKEELAKSNKTSDEKGQYEKNIDRIYDEKFPK